MLKTTWVFAYCYDSLLLQGAVVKSSGLNSLKQLLKIFAK